MGRGEGNAEADARRHRFDQRGKELWEKRQRLGGGTTVKYWFTKVKIVLILDCS